MKSRNIKHAIWLVLAVSAAALAAGGPPEGKGKPGGGAETATNNLSVPMIILGGGSFNGVTCGTYGLWSDLVVPTGVPKDGFEIDPDAYYFVQGQNKWQAPCSNYAVGTNVNVSGAWGDNLTGDAKLKVGSPIRVELVLSVSPESPNYYGYPVVKLEPSLLDRESAYGTLATGENGDATPEMMSPLVYDAKAMMEIKSANGTTVALEDPAGAEINATGKVVYGYNLRVQSAGIYRITFTVPNVTFVDCDAGTCAGQMAELDITVGGGGGGGGGKGGGKPKSITLPGGIVLTGK
jgi:hypothetical protein